MAVPEARSPWVEYDENGEPQPMFNRRTRISGVAMLNSGDVYASFVRLIKDGPPAEIQVGLFRLQKEGSGGDWVAIADTLDRDGQPGAFESLNGTDGAHLVYSRFGEHGWFFSPAPH